MLHPSVRVPVYGILSLYVNSPGNRDTFMEKSMIVLENVFLCIILLLEIKKKKLNTNYYIAC